MPPATRSLYPWKNFFQCLCFFLTPSPFFSLPLLLSVPPTLHFPTALPSPPPFLLFLLDSPLSPVQSRVLRFPSLPSPVELVRSFAPASLLLEFFLSFVSPFSSLSIHPLFLPALLVLFPAFPVFLCPPLFRSLSLSLNRPPTHHAVSFLLFPLFSFSFFSFLLFFCLCTLVRAREFDALCAQTALSRKPLLSQVCSKLDSLPPLGWTVRVFDSASIVIPEVILGRRTWKLRMAVLENL